MKMVRVLRGEEKVAQVEGIGCFALHADDGTAT